MTGIDKVIPLEILIYDHPMLREKCVPVVEGDGELRAQVAAMESLLYDNNGVGLAASQVGIKKRVFIMDTDWVEADEEGNRIGRRNLKVFVNPVILRESEEDGPFMEGCLSLPGIEGEVHRSLSIELAYQDLEGKNHVAALEGLPARVAQHELDHLDGVLFIDRMSFIRRSKLAGALNRLKKEGKAPVR